MVEFREEPIPATEEEVATIEEACTKAPPEWINFYSVRNGGYPKGYVRYKEGPGVYCFPDTEGILYLQRTFKDHNRVPSWTFPFAEEAGGNLWLLSVRKSDYGSVWFWDHEWEAEQGNPPSEENIEKFADSFIEFLHGLEEISV